METFERDGLVLDVRDHAPDGGGEPAGTVVLLHGFPQDASAYDAVAPLLTAAGLRVLVPDQRGYSPRARPRGRSPYVMEELVDDVIALLDQAGVARAHVVGHDWGGGVAWTFAGRRPERTLSLTALSTPHPAAMVWGMRHGDQARRSSYMAWFQVPRVPERVLLAEHGARLREALVSSQLPDPFVGRYVTRLLEPGALTAALAWYRALPVTRGRGAGRTRVPTHVRPRPTGPLLRPGVGGGDGPLRRGAVHLRAGGHRPLDPRDPPHRGGRGRARTGLRPGPQAGLDTVRAAAAAGLTGSDFSCTGSSPLARSRR